MDGGNWGFGGRLGGDKQEQPGQDAWSATPCRLYLSLPRWLREESTPRARERPLAKVWLIYTHAMAAR